MMIKYYVLAILFVSCTAVSNKTDRQACPVVDAFSSDKDQEITFSKGKLKLTDKAIHDTSAPDLFITLKDVYGKNIAGAIVQIGSFPSKKTDINGISDFIAFTNDAGTFDIMIKPVSHSCIQIKRVHFRSGIVRHLEINYSE